jgi:hypothetical protein
MFVVTMVAIYIALRCVYRWELSGSPEPDIDPIEGQVSISNINNGTPPVPEIIISNPIGSKFEMYLNFTNNDYILIINNLTVKEVANLFLFFFYKLFF